ncbi:trimeric intracellular cation channel type B isoform X2 [Scleropages formosus]|nr:trimeric intracellular cation channel type B-like isoform X2 [Scleropages formosus]
MLYCFGGAILSGMLLAEAPVAPLSNNTNMLLATLAWYLVFYCPHDLFYRCAAILPVRLVLSAMKEVTRTWKVLGGVVQAQKKYQNGLLVMVATGWAKGAGGGLISNFEQLVRGVWKPETNELLKMSYPTKVTLIGAVLFALQQNRYLPLEQHQLMSLYTGFLVITKVRMLLTGASYPFVFLETALYRVLFAAQLTDTTSTDKSKEPNGLPSGTRAADGKTVKAAPESCSRSTLSDTRENVSSVPEMRAEGTRKSPTGERDLTGAGSKKTD